jgi:hypothetical protein
LIADTTMGRSIARKIQDLEVLVEAYHEGVLAERK